ncbi:MAG: hypothetical protein IPH30_13110 [Betaproteobacteria bacterium]|nr:hypothetical protein [Betaproteobacteria bacterium]
MAQDFWASSGYRLLDRGPEGWLVPRDDYFRHFLARAELVPPPEAGPGERHLHARLLDKPRLAVGEAGLAAVEDADARENWTEYLRFRDRLLASGSLEACYLDRFRPSTAGRSGPPEAGAIAPPFVDALAQAIVRGLLEGTADPWLARAGELFFRRQRVSVEGGQVLAADASTIEAYAETGGFGNVGRLLKQQQTPVATVKMDVLTAENAPFYFLRDELFSFLLDLTPGREGADALARVLERWVAHFAGVRVAIEPVERVDDERWRWHVGLDVESTAILNALYLGEALADGMRERLATLFRLAFEDPADAIAEVAGGPVYLGLAFREDHTIKLKPQNLLVNLPFARAS